MQLHPDAWCEDGHNESARGGYITVLSLPGHFDLLTGLNGAPVIPHGAHTQGVTRDMYASSEAVWQRNYSFTYAYKLPEEFTGVEILNRPVVSARAKVNHCTVSGKKNVTERPEQTVYNCEFAGCNYVTDSVETEVLLVTMDVRDRLDSPDYEVHRDQSDPSVLPDN